MQMLKVQMLKVWILKLWILKLRNIDILPNGHIEVERGWCVLVVRRISVPILSTTE